jgi:succinoglycan biosynthesis transport protein ExoP
MSDRMNSVDVRRVIAILFRRWRLGLVIVIATLVGVAVTTYLSYPRYEATLKVLIERAPGAEIPYLREQVAFKKAEITQTQCELMRSTPILEEVVRRLNLAERPVPSDSVRDRIHAWLRDVQGWVQDQLRAAKGWLWKVLFKAELEPPQPGDPFREALQDLSQRISVEPLPNTDIIVATVRDIDPVLATQIINTLGEIYLESDLTRQRNRAREIYGLIDSQVTAFKPSYEAAAKAVEDFERDHDARLLEDRIHTKIQEISSLEIALSEFQQRQEAKIESLTLELTALRQTYDDDHPQVRAKRSELDQARQMLSSQSSDQATNKTAAMLAQRIAGANAELEQLSEREGQYSRLLSRLEQEEELFFQLKREREEALIAEATRAAGTQVFEPAITPSKPSTPKWTINLLFGLFGGFSWPWPSARCSNS